MSDEKKKPKEEKDTEGDVVIEPLPIGPTPNRSQITGKAGVFVDEFLDAIDSEGVYKSMGVQPDKTFALTGPPGTGKTLAMRVLNTEANKEAYMHSFSENTDGSVDALVLPYNIGTQGTAYINRGSRKVQRFFDYCRRIASSGIVTIVELDEADALLGARGRSQSHSEDHKVLETIMKNLQEAHDYSGLYIVMMTNLPEICDKAALRAGRLDRIIKFELPTLNERVAGFKMAESNVNERAGYKVVRGLDYTKLAESSDKFSYADIVETVNEAVKQRAKEISKDRTHKIIPAGYATQKKVMGALICHRASFKEKESKRIGYEK